MGKWYGFWGADVGVRSGSLMGSFEFVCSNLPQWLAEGKRYVLLLRGKTSGHSDSRML